MLRKMFCESNGYNCVILVDENGNGCYIDESAFEKGPLTLDVAQNADYSNFDDCETAEEAAANYYTGDNLIEFDPDDWDNVTEFE